jgi:Ni,Fe-hydrogenase III small subunit/NAD-dependent dihydropyrimidine dehydrogenase PreA subunit
MFNILKYRTKYLNQNIPDIRNAKINARHRGLPKIITNCDDVGCNECASVCPSGAISMKPFSIDMGKCVFCGECERSCGNETIKLTSFYKLSATDRNRLIIDKKSDEHSFYKDAVKKLPHNAFKRSLKIRQVSAGGCNGCEMELNACSNVNFDMQRFGIDIVASPRYADCLLITGPVTDNMSKALYDAYKCMPEPRLVILAGACAISGGVFADSPALNREFIDNVKIDLFIPGCPVHPLTVINGLLDLLGRK